MGQNNLGFVTDREDIYSIAQTVTAKLMDKYNLKPSDIGRIEVATETITDHAKAVKTFLMPMFGSNTDIEGIDSMNAC